MKKLYISIVALALGGSLAMAQSPANRTSKTIVADVVAQMPAKQVKAYDKLMADLAGTGQEGVETLVKMMNPPGKLSNAPYEYALHSLSYYVMASGDEAKRSTLAMGYVKVLEQVDERETKAFVMRQMQALGKDECVEALAQYLADAELSGVAARALSAIGSERANQVLVGALRQRRGNTETQQDVINAIAEIGRPGAEPILLAMINTKDANLKKAINFALSRIGTRASLKPLAANAAAAGYTMEPSGANEAYLFLLSRLAVEDGERDIKKLLAEVRTLHKKAAKMGKEHTKIAAAEIIMDIEDVDVIPFVLKAMKDKSKVYRNAILTLASPYADATMYIELLKVADKKQTPATVDILSWIGRESASPRKHEILKSLELKFDRTAYQMLVEQTQKKDFAVKQAAVWTLVKLGHTDFIPSLANMLASTDEQTILLAQDALYAFRGDISESVAKVLPQATDKGKICGLELLGSRKADAQMNTVLEQTEASSADVKAAAYKVLKDVVAAQDFVQLCGMIETCDAPYVSSMQDAIIASLKSKPAAQQMSTITQRMYQAGESKKHLYYKVLAATGEPKALDLIAEGFNAGKGEAKDAAFDALLAWDDIAVADKLFAIAQTTPTYIDAALKAYVKLVSNPTFTGENRLLSLRKAMDIAQTDAQKNLILKHIGNTGTYLALLFAYEFVDNAGTKQAAAMAVKDIALAHKEYVGDNVRTMLAKASAALSHPDAPYDRDAIKKHLAEMPDCKGFVPMFNGKDLTGWKGLVLDPIKRAKMPPAALAKAQAIADDTMRKEWIVTQDGLLMFDGKGYANLCTEKQYADFEMYIDWKLDPAGPEADAGIYLRGTPQVQIWDTSRVNVGAQVGSGGLYNNQSNLSKPLTVADNKLGEWNTFHIKMLGDRVTVYLNGELVTDNVMLENYWDRKQPIFPVEQIELQAHGSKVYYRNIYIKELKTPEPFQLSDQEKKEGYKILFDGTNMHHWQGNTVDYALEDGLLTLTPSKSFGGNLYTKDEYANFVFRFQFQLTAGANNGLGIRTPMGVDAAYHGMELQILDNDAPIYKDLHLYQYHGSVYGVIPAQRGALKPLGEWNEQEVIANGDHIKVTLNGTVILDGNIRKAAANGTADKKQHPGLFNKKGYIGFLGHGSPLKFRHIRIKELK